MKFKFIAIWATLALAVPIYAEDSSPMPASKTSNGIEGIISLGPTHGGPIREGRSSSARLANTEFTVLQEERTVASFKTDEQGAFHVSLPPGKYTVALKERKRGPGRFGPFEVEVTVGKATKVEWHCDTGMR